MADRDLYKILGVPRGASDDEIRSAYRKLARKYHPDVNPGKKDAEEKFKEVSGAYDILSNKDKRKLYDEFGEEATRGDFDPEKARAYKQWKSGRRTTQHPFQDESFEFDLGDLFGGGMGGFGRGAPQERPSARDITAVAELEFVQALKGVELSLEVPVDEPCGDCRGTGDKPGTSRTCPDCGGSGRAQAVRGPMQLMRPCAKCNGRGKVGNPCASCGGQGTRGRREKVTVRVPPGADDGSRLRVAGRGIRGGDIVIETRVRPHPYFRREGLELYLKLPVTLDEAYDGATVEVPTPDGPVKLRVPPRSQNGAKLRLRGHGVTRGKEKGNLYVELDVRVPDRDDPRIAEALRTARDGYSHPVREGIRL